jgi:hypothetical protein
MLIKPESLPRFGGALKTNNPGNIRGGMSILFSTPKRVEVVNQ